MESSEQNEQAKQRQTQRQRTGWQLSGVRGLVEGGGWAEQKRKKRESEKFMDMDKSVVTSEIGWGVEQ